MWRDPLDELVEDLERLAPRPTSDYHSQFEMLQRLSDAVLYGTEDEVEALKRDPDYLQWVRRSSAARGRFE